MIPISWKHNAPIRNLPELLRLYHQHGGSIVQYRHIFSVLIYSQTSSVFEWLPPNANPKAAGRKHAVWCFFFGWWSARGIFGTPIAIHKNLSGGTDVTALLVAPPLPGEPPVILNLIETPTQKQSRLVIVLIVLIALIIFFALGEWLTYDHK